MYSLSRRVSKSPIPKDDDGKKTTPHQKAVENLMNVENSLRSCLKRHSDGKYGYITKEWGFITPGGLGDRLGGKFEPWEDKLRKTKDFFWPMEAYESMEHMPYGKVDKSMVQKFGLKKEAEQLYGNTPLYEFLMEPPRRSVELVKEDLQDYKRAAKIFILLGTLTHLCGNSSPDPKTCPLPEWMEDPLRMVAERLDVEPTLTGHFLVQENWIYKDLLLDDSSETDDEDLISTLKKKSCRSLVSHSSRTLSSEDREKATDELDRLLIKTLVNECIIGFQRSRQSIYPDSFVGSQAVDVAMDNNFCETREEGVRMIRDVNTRHKLFRHVRDPDFLLMDKHEFYQFYKKWTNPDLKPPSKASFDFDPRKAYGESSPRSSGDEEISWNPSRSAQYLPSRLMPASPPVLKSKGGDDPLMRSAAAQMASEGTLSEDIILGALGGDNDDGNGIEKSVSLQPPSVAKSIVVQPSDFPDYASLQRDMAVIDKLKLINFRKGRSHSTKSFAASQAVNLLLDRDCARSRSEATRLLRGLNERYSIFEKVTMTHEEFKDDNALCQFTNAFEQIKSAEDPLYLSSHQSKIPQSTIQQERSDKFFQSGALPDDNNGDDVPGAQEFRFDNIVMLYPAFQNNHERVNQLIPTCMGYAFRSLPYLIVELLGAMRSFLEFETLTDSSATVDGSFESKRIVDIIYQLAYSCSRCKEQFQLMSTDPTKRSFNSKHVSIRQTQPLSNGVLVRRKKGSDPLPSKGTTGTQFPYFHLLDWLLGRFQFNKDKAEGLVAKIASVDNTFPKPQREYIESLMTLEYGSTIRGFMDLIGRPKEIMVAYNHLIECYAGEGGVLQAHCRKLYSYVHNDVQASTSGTNHVATTGKGERPNPISSAEDNHIFANTMFRHMRMAADERWELRIPPLMARVRKRVYSTSESGGFTTVALDFGTTALRYEYGDVVKVLLPNDDTTTLCWVKSLSVEDSGSDEEHVKLQEISSLHKRKENGWGWEQLWEALGWSDFEKDGGLGVPLSMICRYIEQGQIRTSSGKTRWVKSTLDLCGKGKERILAIPPTISRQDIASLDPVSPRIYSVSGVEAERVFLLVSKPVDGSVHHGYERMADPHVDEVHCSFSPATFFLVPPEGANLVCVASGTGISPFVGLAEAIGTRQGTFTIAHQCKSSDLFLSNSQAWLDFTVQNPGAVVMGFISGDRSRRNCPMRYIIRNGAFEETFVLGAHSTGAYYFQCDLFEARLKEVYDSGALNLAYCCGGTKSAIQPLQQLFRQHEMSYEFTVECYGISAPISSLRQPCEIGGTIVNLDNVSSVHPGGDQILYQIQDIEIERGQSSGCPVSTPDHSASFWQLHPHAYNLHRCLRAPLDADFEAFSTFLQRQAVNTSTLFKMAEKYTEVAMKSPEDSKVLRIATELQSTAVRRHYQEGDMAGAEQAVEHLRGLLSRIPSLDEDVRRWNRVVDDYQNGSLLDS
eukprot:scaffold1223_cov119-Cylindrotheca_fusiformis.AAC.25